MQHRNDWMEGTDLNDARGRTLALQDESIRGVNESHVLSNSVSVARVPSQLQSDASISLHEPSRSQPRHDHYEQQISNHPPVRIWPPMRSNPIAIASPINDSESRSMKNKHTNNDDTSSNEESGNRDVFLRPPVAQAGPQQQYYEQHHHQQQSFVTTTTTTTTHSNNHATMISASPSTTNKSDSDATTTSNFTSSLPSRLLRAPLLGSLPSRNIPAAALPSPLTLSSNNNNNVGDFSLNPSIMLDTRSTTTNSGSDQQQTQTQTSYGSLRESHLRGRFFDGPSSYRDGRTGGIYRIQQQPRTVRFPDMDYMVSSSYSGGGSGSGGGMSIGDRMRAQTQRNKTAAAAAAAAKSQEQHNQKSCLSKSNIKTSTTTTTTTKEASTLSKLIESCSETNNNTGSNTESYTESNTHVINDTIMSPTFLTTTTLNPTSLFDQGEAARRDALPSYALSTSLTGLEILQQGVWSRGIESDNMFATASTINTANKNNNNKEAMTDHDNHHELRRVNFQLDELPRDLNGHNAIFARSVSDPNPTLSRPSQSVPYRTSPVLPSLLGQQDVEIKDFVRHGSFLLPPTCWLPTQSSGESLVVQVPSGQLTPGSTAVTTSGSVSQQAQTHQLPTSLLSGALLLSEITQQQQEHEEERFQVVLGEQSLFSMTAASRRHDDNPDTEAAFQIDME